MSYFVIFLIILVVNLHIAFNFSFNHNSIRLQRRENHVFMNKNPDILTIEGIAGRYKVISYGNNADSFGIECVDTNYISSLQSIVIEREGGLGLDLAEMQKAKGKGGLVLISDILPASNANKAGKFKIGDALISISDAKNPSNTQSLQGLNFDSTINAIKSFDEKVKSFEITVNRLVKREQITVEVYGPDNTFVESFTIPTGFNINLRRELQSRDFTLYDQRTYRFDSPYQTGDCGGEGSCGTCCIAIKSGNELLNSKVRVEDMAMKKQGCPPNWRWACRATVGPSNIGNKGGVLKLVLRPQSAY